MSTSAGGSPRRRRMLRVALVTVFTLLILVGIFAFTISGNGAAAVTTSQVRGAFTEHLSNFGSENTTTLMRDYAPNATLKWGGTTRGLGGTYNTTALVSQFYSAFFSKVTNVSVKNATFTVQVIGSGASVNGTFSVLGGGPQVQTITGEVMASVAYVQVNGVWVISSETWDFLSLNLQRPLA
jgi:hypothetical protein